VTRRPISKQSDRLTVDVSSITGRVRMPARCENRVARRWNRWNQLYHKGSGGQFRSGLISIRFRLLIVIS